MDDWIVDWIARIFGGIIAGVVMGLIFFFIAVIMVLLSGRYDLMFFLQLAVVYVLGGASVGAVLGAISDLARWKSGVAVMGFIGGFGAYFGASLLISGGEITKIHIITSLLLALVVGVPGAFLINRHR